MSGRDLLRKQGPGWRRWIAARSIRLAAVLAGAALLAPVAVSLGQTTTPVEPTHYDTRITTKRYPRATRAAGLLPRAWEAGLPLTLGYVLEAGQPAPFVKLELEGQQVKTTILRSVENDRLVIEFAAPDPEASEEICEVDPGYPEMYLGLKIVFSDTGESFEGSVTATCSDRDASGRDVYLFDGRVRPTYGNHHGHFDNYPSATLVVRIHDSSKGNRFAGDRAPAGFECELRALAGSKVGWRLPKAHSLHNGEILWFELAPGLWKVECRTSDADYEGSESVEATTRGNEMTVADIVMRKRDTD